MGGISSAIGDATGQGGKGGFGAPQQSGGQPQMGFGFNPNTDMPFTGQAGQTLSDGLNSAFGGLPGVMPLVNTAGQVANTAFGGMANSIQGNQPAPQPMPTNNFDPSGMQKLGWTGASPAVIGWQPPSAYKDSQGNYFDDKGNALTYTPGSSGNEAWNKNFGTLKDAQGNLYGGGSFGGGKGGFGPQIGYQPRPEDASGALRYAQPQGSQIGFGFNPNTGGPLGGAINNVTDASGQILNQLGMPQVGNAVSGLGGLANGIFGNLLGGRGAGGGLYGRDLSGNPNTQQLMGGMGTFTNVPAPQPVNRFAPPNAPGVRTQPRTAPRAGVSAQSARTLRPTTRNRLR